MSEEYGSGAELSGEEKQSRPWLWIVIIGVVLFCCVCGGLGAAGWWLWTNGDEIFGLDLMSKLVLYASLI